MNKKQYDAKGFTLIELLVVIAIIGVLASVVLASLNTARNKGADAAIKSNINNARAQAALYYDSNNQSYDGVCAAESSASPGGIATMVSGAQAAGSLDVVCADPATNSDETWVVSAQLKSDTGQYWCMDSTGTSTPRTSQITTASTSC